MPTPIVIKFYSPVNEASIGQLLKAVNQKLANCVDEVTLQTSTSGGRRLCVPQARFLMHPVSMNFRELRGAEAP
jgi:hypothetical protein